MCMYTVVSKNEYIKSIIELKCFINYRLLATTRNRIPNIMNPMLLQMLLKALSWMDTSNYTLHMKYNTSDNQHCSIVHTVDTPEIRPCL